jgi:hypothetical protein
MKNIKEQRTDEQIQFDNTNTNVRVSMARLRKTQSQKT